MNVLPILGWLVRDTFRQALASGVCTLMLGVTVLCAFLCLTVSIAPVPDTGTRVSLAFGAAEMDLPGDAAQAVRTLQLHLASGVGDTAGLLLVLLWTAGFLPGFLEPANVSVLLAKPVSRGTLLLGKYAGVLTFVAVQAALFLSATWLALGLRTGVWDGRYFLALPLLLLHFGVFFSFSAMLAVATRSTGASVFGSVFFWLLCWALNFGRHTVWSLEELPTTAGFGRGIELAYWLLPKPLDFHVVVLHTLEADNLLGVIDLPLLAQRGAWLPGWSLAASLTTAGVLLALAVYDFGTRDY
jgi:hypothetical protein